MNRKCFKIMSCVCNWRVDCLRLGFCLAGYLSSLQWTLESSSLIAGVDDFLILDFQCSTQPRRNLPP